MRNRYGPFAVVAGASDGIGAAFAAELATHGLDLVLVARRAGPLEEVAVRLRDAHGVAVRTIAADLATPDGIAALVASTEDIGLVVVNAASAPIASYVDLSAEQLGTMLALNVAAAARLTHAFGPRLLERGRGGVVLLSSLASYQGSAVVAHYAATKAYLRVLAEGLWYEWRPYGVDVLACCPGLVATPSYERDGPTPGRLVPPPLDPAAVAREALAALGRRPVMVPGWRNRVTGFLATRVLPRRAAIALTSRQTAAMYRVRLGPTE